MSKPIPPPRRPASPERRQADAHLEQWLLRQELIRAWTRPGALDPRTRAAAWRLIPHWRALDTAERQLQGLLEQRYRRAEAPPPREVA